MPALQTLRSTASKARVGGFGHFGVGGGPLSSADPTGMVRPAVHPAARRSVQRTVLSLSALLAAGMALSACSVAGSSTTFASTTPVAGASGTATVASGSIIDGFTLGVLSNCSGPVGPVSSAALIAGCTGDPARAVAALDARDPGHAAIVATSTWSDGTQPGAIDVTGGSPPPPLVPVQPGSIITVFVFRLADGSTRAIGVACSESRPCVGVGSYPK